MSETIVFPLFTECETSNRIFWTLIDEVPNEYIYSMYMELDQLIGIYRYYAHSVHDPAVQLCTVVTRILAIRDVLTASECWYDNETTSTMEVHDGL